MNNTLQNNNSNLLSNSSKSDPFTIGVVAAKNEDVTTALASFTSSLFYPQISYNSYNLLLSDRKIFPFLYKTTPSMHVQATAIADIVSYFYWNWIAVVIAGSDYFNSMQSTLSTIIRNRHICISVKVILQDNYTQSDLSQAVSQLKRQNRSNTIILVGEESIIYNFLLAAQVENLTGKTFIGTYTWINSPKLQHISRDILAGALGIDID